VTKSGSSLTHSIIW